MAKVSKTNPKKNTTKTADDVFKKLKGHFDSKKVDEWQKKWLAVPENRKKYKKVTDAPGVVGEELVAMVNDIVDFAQGEEAGKSHLFAKAKKSLSGLLKPLTSKQSKTATPTKKSKKPIRKTK
jgi:hypothetical protein